MRVMELTKDHEGCFPEFLQVAMSEVSSAFRAPGISPNRPKPLTTSIPDSEAIVVVTSDLANHRYSSFIDSD